MVLNQTKNDIMKGLNKTPKCVVCLVCCWCAIPSSEIVLLGECDKSYYLNL